MGVDTATANTKISNSARASAGSMMVLSAAAVKSNAGIASSAKASADAMAAQTSAPRLGVSPYVGAMKSMENSTINLGRQALATKAKVVSLFATGKKMSGFGRGIMMETTLPAAGISALGLVRSAQFESFRISFGALMRDVEVGEKTFKELVSFAEKTPFDLREVMKGSQVLLSMGLAKTPEGIIDLMTLLGDLTALSPTADLNAIAINMAQIKGIGKMQMMDFKQFATAGIPIKQAILDIVNVKRELKGLELATSKDFFAAMEAGSIPFELVEKAMRHLVSEGQPFFKGMERQVKTLGGRWSNFVDVINTTAASFGDLIEKTLGVKVGLIAVTEKLQNVQSWFVKMKKDTGWQGKMLIWATLFAILLGPVVFIVGRLVSAFGLLKTAFLFLFKSPTKLIALVNKFRILKIIASGLSKILLPLKILMLAIGAITVMADWKPFRDLLKSIWGLMGRLVDRAIEFGKSFGISMPDWVKQIIESPGLLVRFISGGKTASELGDIAGIIANSAGDMLNSLSSGIDRMYPQAPPLMAPVYNPIENAISETFLQIGLDRGLKINTMHESSNNTKTHFNLGFNAVSGPAGSQ